MPTPYEKGNQNQTTTWSECIAFYEALAQRFPHVLRFEQIGTSDGGIPVHAGVVSADGVHDRAQIKAEGRTVFFNNNGIHPGEPEGVDACMAIVRDLCFDPARLAALGKTVLLFVPLYNVDGALNRANTSRVNQDGPEQFGFRGNSRHLDLNRDFVKCDTLNARIFNQLLTSWDPDVMVDTHTSNGADYPYTMTLIHTQADKLGYGLGPFLRETMLPHIYKEMEAKGWPTCPYVNPVKDTPDDGIAEFLEVPRFSTGFAALHHVIGFMPETHMLKPFKDRYDSMRALLDVTMAFTISTANRSAAARRRARAGRQRHRMDRGMEDGRSQSIDLPLQRLRSKAQPSAAGRLPAPVLRPQQAVGKGYRLLQQLRAGRHRARAERLHRAAGLARSHRTPAMERRRHGPLRRSLHRGSAVLPHRLRDLAPDRLRRPYVPRRRAAGSAHRQLHRAAGRLLHPAQAGQRPLRRRNAGTARPRLFFRWGFFNSVLEKKKTSPTTCSKTWRWKCCKPSLN
jgi:hypothetical protein